MFRILIVSKGSQYEALIDADNADHLGQLRWSIGTHGHAVRVKRIDGRDQMFYLRREVMAPLEANEWVQTISDDKLDCRRENLRVRRRYDELWRETNLWRNYGITLDIYNQMLAAQGGACAICGLTPDEKAAIHGAGRVPAAQRRLAVDHCSESGRVRGLLCFECNTGIGKLQHDPVVLQQAIRYLAS